MMTTPRLSKLAPLATLLAVLCFVLWLIADTPASANESAPEGIGDEYEFDVTAECRPHAIFRGPKHLHVRFVARDPRADAPAEMDAFMRVDALAEDKAHLFSYEHPERAWMSAVFEGPVIEKILFCYEFKVQRHAHFSYYRTKDFNLAIAAGPAAGLIKGEMDAVDTPKTETSTIPLLPRDDKKQSHIFSAGKETNSVYYLQFSIPLYPSEPTVNTMGRYTTF